ncbi:hypothetical protein CBER1_10086 [Cercospora berteroae]|uniref:PHD-type domain-containing protein n=1 Tax=Cercospora berteroae TaxID=357750 RepID=A0A2S6BWW2_9PEZI|nr:hypothetical protein CBER1_10086 [Cercospora berteroae]
MTSQKDDERDPASPVLAETPKTKNIRPARKETMDEKVGVHDHTEHLSSGFRRGSTVPTHTPITRDVLWRLPSRALEVVDNNPDDRNYSPSSKKLPPSRRTLATGRSDNANMTSTEDAPLPAPRQEDENRSIVPGAPALRSRHPLHPKPCWLSRRYDDYDPDGSVYDTGLCKDNCADPATEEMIHCNGEVCYRGGGWFHLHCVYFKSAPPMPDSRKWFCFICRDALDSGKSSNGLVPSDEELVQKRKDGKGKGRRLGDDLVWEMKK